MTMSDLVSYVRISPNTSGIRQNPVSKITVHHMAGDLTVETCGDVFAPVSRQASSNYGVGSDGRVACYLEEEWHPWTSASWWNDDRAITIEVADYDTSAWSPSDAAYQSTVALCADICNRYGIEPYYDGSIYASFTEHQMFASTSCPGPWWHARMYQFVEDVKAAMEGEDVVVTDEVVERIAERTKNKVWEYTYHQGLPDQDMTLDPTGKSLSNRYNMLNAAFAQAKQANERLDAIEAKLDRVSAGDVDYELLAEAVADELSARMKD